MFALVATELILSTTNGAIEPTPVTSRPILVLLLNQVISAPGMLEVRFIRGVVVPWQKVRLGLSVIFGAGLTGILNVTGFPEQPIMVGIMLIFADTTMLVLLTAGNEGINDTGIALKYGTPMKVPVYDQKNAVLGLGPLSGMMMVPSLGQTRSGSVTGLAIGNGITSTFSVYTLRSEDVMV